MLHSPVENNSIISTLVELTTSKNPYTDSSPSYWTNNTDIINNKKPSRINALEVISPHLYCHIKHDVTYLFILGSETCEGAPRPWGRDQWSSMRDFLWLGTLRGEWITCLEVLDHSTAYSYTSTSICCRSRSSEANDPSLTATRSNGLVINMSDLRMDLKLHISRRSTVLQGCLTVHDNIFSLKIFTY